VKIVFIFEKIVIVKVQKKKKKKGLAGGGGNLRAVAAAVYIGGNKLQLDKNKRKSVSSPLCCYFSA